MLHNNAEPYNTYIKESSLDITYNSAATPLLVKNGHKTLKQNVPPFPIYTLPFPPICPSKLSTYMNYFFKLVFVTNMAEIRLT